MRGHTIRQSLLGDVSPCKPCDCELSEPSRCQATHRTLKAAKLPLDRCIEIARPHELTAGNHRRNLLRCPRCSKWRDSARENIGTHAWLDRTAILDTQCVCGIKARKLPDLGSWDACVLER